MDAINFSDLKKLIATAHQTLCVVLHALNTKILVGEINRPTDPAPKIKRKRRTKREMSASGIPPVAGMSNLPDADEGSTFYQKKKREKKIDGGE